MPATTFLHIETRDSAPTRVLEIPGTSVRIGRGDQCEVRLGEPSLAEVQCMLRRRGEGWHLQPVGPSGRVSIEGRAVEQPRPLPLGVPVRVGQHWLTLRPAEPPAIDAWAACQSHDRPGFPTVPAEATAPESATATASSSSSSSSSSVPRRESLAGDDAGRDRLRLWKERQEQRERWLKARQEERRWEARWRAAGENLRARAATPPAPLPVAESAATRAPFEGRKATTTRPAASSAAEAVAPVVDVPAFEPSGAVVDVPSRTIAEPNGHALPSTDGVAWDVGNEPPAEPSPDREDPAFPDRGEDLGGSASECVANPSPSVIAAEVEAEPEAKVEPPAVTPPRPRRRKVATLGVSLDPSELEDDWDARELATVPAPDSTIWAGLLNLLSTTVPVASAFVPGPAPETYPYAVEEGGYGNGLQESLAGQFVAEGQPGGAPDALAAEGLGDEPASAVEEPGGPEWPSARTIFQQARRPAAATAPAKAARSPVAKRPVLTAARKPGHWDVPAPGWLWVPCFSLTLLAGAVSIGMAATWAGDDQSAGAVADRLVEREAPITPEEARLILDGTPGGTSWWRTTAGHLLLKAAVADRADAEGRGQVALLLNAARDAAPAHSGVRLALARTARGKADPASATRDLGLGRDVVALAWTGRRLLEAGKPVPALRAYRGALEMAAGSGASSPKFLADVTPGRFALPGEDLLAPVVRDMAGRPEWSFGAWAPALEGLPVAAVVAARLLKEASSPDADRAIDAALAHSGTDGPHAASRAEALALRERWEEAAREYGVAIAAAADGRTRRAWSYNLAEIYGRFDEGSRRRSAWDDAKGRGPDDEISRRVAAARAQAGPGEEAQAVAAVRP